MDRRSSLEMCFDVLEVIDKGTHKPSKIMFATNLSYASRCRTLETLVNSDFIREEKRKKSKRYYITKKGKNALLNRKKSLEGLLKAL